MFIINEKTSKLTNFIAPSMVVAVGAILLGFLQNLIITILVISNFALEVDILILSLLLTFLSQVAGSLIIYFLVIPIMKINEVQKQSFTSRNLVRTVLLLCSTFTVSILSNYIFNFFFDIFNLVPQSGYSGILLNESHLGNPLNVVIYFLPFVLGAPVFEELLYRRTIIPMLEKRGMAPFTAVLTSSIVFSIAHFPNDLINGNVYGGISHCIVVFYISISLGIVYTLTRNILFPMILHSFVNFISFSGPLVNILQNQFLFWGYSIVAISITVIGIGLFIYSGWRYFKRSSTDWVKLLKTRSSQKMTRGLIVFLLIGIISPFIPIMIEMLSLNEFLRSNNYSQYLTSLLASYTIVVILFFLLGSRARFTPDKKTEREVK